MSEQRAERHRGQGPRSPGDVGRLVASLLAGSWRGTPDPLSLADDDAVAVLHLCEPPLLGASCGPLVHRRLRAAGDHARPAAEAYRQAYRYHASIAAVDLRRIADTILLLRSHGVEPLVVKGWATARLYPELAARPFGDLDLVVRPEERSAVEPALLARLHEGSGALPPAAVDLHESVADLVDRPLDELRARAVSAPIGDPSGTRVLVLGDEDHLRLLALHLLRHGAWRPLWLCDVALLVERLGATLDWDLCLRGSHEGARRVALVLGLAHELLGAALPDTLPRPAARAARALPRWMVDATLRQWGRPYQRYSDDGIRSVGPRPRPLVAAARRRWPNPIEASVSVGAPFNGAPRLPFQLADVLRRVKHVLRPG